jgi:hypothetical protein
MVRPCVARDFAELVVSGLASMYPAFDWSACCSGHHGYQRVAGHTTAQSFSAGSGTDIGHANTGNTSSAAGNRDAGAASVALTYSLTPSAAWASIVFDQGCLRRTEPFE